MVKIYAIVCKPTGQAYIGITAGKLAKRFREHKCLAKSGKHHSPALAEAWRLHGDAAFGAEELEVIPAEAGLIEKREVELRWLKSYEARGLLLNKAVVSYQLTKEATAKGVEASRHIVGNRWTPEANELRRQAQLGIPKNHGAKISATKRAKREQMMR